MRTKKADVAEHPKVFDHVGLLVNQPPGINRAAVVLVVRRHWEAALPTRPQPDTSHSRPWDRQSNGQTGYLFSGEPQKRQPGPSRGEERGTGSILASQAASLRG